MMATKVATLTRVNAADSAIVSQDAVPPCPPKRAAQRRQHHEGQHHDEVFDDQPADRDPAALGFQDASFLQGADQDDRTGDRQRQTEDQPGPHGPAEAPRERHAEQGGDRDLNDGAGQGYGPDRHQIFKRKMQADREHQQNHADFGQLVGKRLIGDEPRRKGTDDDTGEQITDQRRHAQSVRRQPENKSQCEADSDNGDKRRVMPWH